MNIDELQQQLDNLKIPTTYYSLSGGLPNERLCLEEVNTQWHIYYSERGHKNSLAYFTSEKEACDFFLTTINKMI
ncbi:MAG: hypothetical protein ACRC5A_08415 [Enterobacteriaceae bacterium]